MKALVIILLAVLQLFICDSFSRITPRIEFTAENYGLTAEEGLSSDNLNGLNGQKYTFEKDLPAWVNGESAIVRVTNENYALFGEIEVIRGVYFGEMAAKIGQNYAVISEIMAFEQFGTLDCVGMGIVLDGFSYTISGVYTQNAMLSLFSGDGREVLYVPSNSGFDRQFGGETPIHRMCFMPAENGGVFSDRELVSVLETINLNIRNYLLRDLSQTDRVLAQFSQLELFAAGVCAALFIIELVYKYTTRHIRHADAQAILRSACLLAASAAAAALIYRLTSFEPYVPPGLLPQERLLDFEHYAQLVTDSFQHSNIYYAFKASGYERLYYALVGTNAVFTAAVVAIIIRIYLQLRESVKELSHGRHNTKELA